MQHSEISVGTHGYFAAGLVLAIETSLARQRISFYLFSALHWFTCSVKPRTVTVSPTSLRCLLMIPTLKGEISLISYLICLEEDVQGLFTLVVN